jgi:hypothetical protein
MDQDGLSPHLGWEDYLAADERRLTPIRSSIGVNPNAVHLKRHLGEPQVGQASAPQFKVNSIGVNPRSSAAK